MQCKQCDYKARFETGLKGHMNIEHWINCNWNENVKFVAKWTMIRKKSYATQNNCMCPQTIFTGFENLSVNNVKLKIWLVDSWNHMKLLKNFMITKIRLTSIRFHSIIIHLSVTIGFVIIDYIMCFMVFGFQRIQMFPRDYN